MLEAVLKLRPKPPDVEDARFCTLQGSLFCEQDENRTWAFRDRQDLLGRDKERLF